MRRTFTPDIQPLVRGETLNERVIWGVALHLPDPQPQAAFEALPPDAVLVYGPSIYGANIPWSPS